MNTFEIILVTFIAATSVNAIYSIYGKSRYAHVVARVIKENPLDPLKGGIFMAVAVSASAYFGLMFLAVAWIVNYCIGIFCNVMLKDRLIVE